MSELEDRISGVLNDPAQMAQIMDMAKSLMGGESAAAPKPEGGLPALLQGVSGGAAPDPGLMNGLAGLLSNDGGRDRRALLEAIKPWISARRREKLERAVRMARLARLAAAALGETGGGSHV